MFTKSIPYYDLIYSFKNYKKEASQLVELIHAEHPGAKSILDVGCGTGEHAKHLSAQFDVDGIDINSEFVAIAQKKNHSGQFSVVDMSNFDLGKQYDVVMCLFGSIGYLKQKDQISSALRCFRKHLNPGGRIIVEPWFTPENWKTGVPFMVNVNRANIKISRVNISERVDNYSVFTFHYLVATKQGVEYFTEYHELALYTTQEIMICFNQAGLAVKHDSEGLFGRGMYIARVPEFML